MEKFKQLVKDIKGHAEGVVKRSEKYMFLSRFAEMDMEVQRSIRTIKEAQKLLGMVELLEIFMNSLTYGESEKVRSALMEQLQVLRETL